MCVHEATVSIINNILALLVFCQNFIGMKHAVVDSLVRALCYYNVDRVVLKTGQIEREITSRMETDSFFVFACVREKVGGRRRDMYPLHLVLKHVNIKHSPLQQ